MYDLLDTYKCLLLITFAYSLDPDQIWVKTVRHSYGRIFWKGWFWKKISRQQKCMQNYPVGNELRINGNLEIWYTFTSDRVVTILSCRSCFTYLFAYWVILHAFFQNQLFWKKSFSITIRVSNSLDSDQAPWSAPKTQQMTLVGKELYVSLKKSPSGFFMCVWLRGGGVHLIRIRSFPHWLKIHAYTWNSTG